ncbi:MAG: hypothetical protein QXN46_00850 [Candidatus Woesearchaeota archaeon]
MAERQQANIFSKKAQLLSHHTKFLFISLPFVIISALALFLLANRFLEIRVNTFPLEANAFVESILYSSAGLAYVDNVTGITYSGIIDITKLEEKDIGKRLSKAFNYGEGQSYLAAKLLIGDRTIFYNNEPEAPWYDRWKPKVGLKGAGGVQSVTFVKYVLIKNGSMLEPATVYIELLKPGEG